MYMQALHETVYERDPCICNLKFKHKKLTVGNHFSFKITITWREREHTTIDNEVMNDQKALDALRGCGLLKFFKMPNMKAKTCLLEMLIHYWSIEDDAFMINQMPLRIEVEDIYFITGLSWRGELVHSIG